MKQGRAPADLIEEITRQRESKVDYVTDTRHLSLTPGDAGVRLNIAGHDDYEISDHTHHQVAERVGIPAKYYNTMLKDAPDLLRTNVNHWFQAKPEKRMVRTLDGRVRAFLSDRYRPLDNYDLTLAVLPVLAESGASLESCEVTDDRMYLKGVLRSVQTKIPAPAANGRSNAATDVVVSPGIVISNSEIGTGALAVQPAVHFLNCLNMATWARHTLRKFHIGKQAGRRGRRGLQVLLREHQDPSPTPPCGRRSTTWPSEPSRAGSSNK